MWSEWCCADAPSDLGRNTNRRLVLRRRFVRSRRRSRQRGAGYGETTSAGQFGAAAPLESAQLIRPIGGPRTNGVSGLLAVT